MQSETISNSVSPKERFLDRAASALRRVLCVPPELSSEAAARLRAQQIGAVVKATPLMMGGNMLCAAAVVVVFWNTEYRSLLVTWALLFSAMSALAILRWRQHRHLPPRPHASRGAILRLAQRVMIPALFLACLPLAVFAGVDPQKKLLVSSIVSGALCVGLFGLASVPLAALSYSVVIVSASLVAMALTGDSDFVAIGLLLLVYAACALGSVAWFSRLFVDRFVHGLELEKQSELIGILLHDFEKQASDWLWETDEAGRLGLGAARFAEALGADAAGLAGRPLLEALQIETGVADGEQAALLAALSRREAFGGLAAPFLARGERRWLSLTGKPVTDANGRFAGYRGVASDVTEAKRSESHIRHMALHDALTGLPNRTTFADRLDRALLQVKSDGKPFAVVLIDLDNFKAVNDTLGHGAGDALLVEMSARLAALAPADALLARLGGDEFALIVEMDADHERFGLLAERIEAVLTSSFDLGGVTVSVGGSIGVACAPEDGLDAETLLRRADLALYRAKADGRGCMRRFDAAIEAAAQHRRVVEQDLRAAIDRGELDIHYQPIVLLDTGRFVGAEALLRWRHPVFGQIPPDQFIPIAEETGLIIPIGRWVLERACREASSWPDDITLSVNLSPSQFKDPTLSETIRGALAASGLPASRLELEITETALMAEGSARGLVEQVKSLGVKLALDDFGTGYASLSYLRQLPFDKIKIDRSFVRESVTNPDSLAIIETIVDLGRKLATTTTAEGIETRFERGAATRAGCVFGQGWAFGKAMPLADFVKLLGANRREAA